MTTLVSTREQRRRQLGVDCPDRITWKEWEAGEEYSRTLCIKNVEGRPQIISFKLPERKATFLTPFPEPMTLSSGVSFDLDIRFCPTAVQEILDCIEVTVSGRGSFVVYLQAMAPFARLRCTPSSFDFEYCPVNVASTEKVEVANTGTAPVEFTWEVPPPYGITPLQGLLQPGETASVTVSFTPREAYPALCQGICKMKDTEDVVTSIRLSGVGKYPYVRFDYTEALQFPADILKRKGASPYKLSPINYVTALLDFKELHAGSTTKAEFYVENPSPVTAQVGFLCEDDALVCPFKVSPSTAQIPRCGRQQFTVTFKARGTGARHCNRFQLRTFTGISHFLEVRGAVVGPRVTASISAVNYGDVDLDKMPVEKERTRYVQLKNHSKCPAHYQVTGTAPGAAFAVEPVSATIDPQDSIKVKIIFRPTHAMNYLRRLLILVQDAADVLFIDVLGSAFNSLSRPLPFGLPQVEAFHLRMERGLGLSTPLELEAVYTSVLRGLPASSPEAQEAQLVWQSIDDDVKAVQSKSFLQKRSSRMSFEAFLASATPPCPFSIDRRALSFDAFSPRSQSVILSNSSSAMATGAWCLPAQSPYTVSPQQQDIPPGGSATFIVSHTFSRDDDALYCPSGDATLSSHFLECYVSFKQMRSFRLVSEDSFIPPHCFVVQCGTDVGALARGTVEAPVTMDSVLNFPSCSEGQSVYQVVSIINNGAVALGYEMNSVSLSKVSEKVHEDVAVIQDGGAVVRSDHATTSPPEAAHGRSGVFHCHPAVGLLRPQQRELVLFEFSPTSHARFEAEGVLNLNQTSKSNVTVHLRGETFIPRLQLEAGSLGKTVEKLLLRPTCISGESRLHLRLYNPTCLRISYECIPSHELLGTVRMKPSSGVLEGFERTDVTACFSPEMTQRYEGTVSFVLRTEGTTQDDQRPTEHLMTWGTIGEGVTAIAEMVPTSFDCGEIAGLKPQTISLTLYNSSSCELNYEVRSMTCKEPTAWRRVSQPPRLRNHIGTMPARSHAMILVTVHPSAGLSEFILYAMVADVSTNLSAVIGPSTTEEAEKHPHCRVTVRGTRPAVQVVDVRSLTQQRSHLWRQLSINELNQQLGSAVQPSDVENVTYTFYQYIEGLVPVSMDLVVGRQDSIPASIFVMLANSGDCPADFNLWFPTENSVSQETWYLDDEELASIHAVLDRGIVSITPRSGTIPVGGSVTIAVTYRFDEVGIHTLPVVLRINDGKKVLLVMEGRTVPYDMDCLTSHHASEYALLPVELGDMEPPMQSMLLENPLDREVSYQVDLDALRRLADQNYGFPILQCVNPEGTLPPRSLTTVQWYFRPLEEKEYVMTVPISTGSGESYTYTFMGRGYHPQKVSMEARRQFTEDAMLAIPHAPALKLLPALPVSLSMEVMRFGPVPYFALYRRSCTLRNDHPNDTYSFQWDPRHDYGDHVFNISPTNGLLLPGAEVECRMNFYSGSTSQLLGWSIACHIRNESDIERTVAESHFTEEVVSGDGETSVAAHPTDAATAPTVYAADGIGERVNCWNSTFTRTTCTKRTYHARTIGDVRKPVTTIPLESLGIPALRARLAAGRRRQFEGLAAATHEPATTTVPSKEAVTWNCLEVLVQAHVMPVDAYERLYGSESLQRAFQPVVHMFQDPLDQLPHNSPLSATLDMARMTHNIMDELLRSVVAQPKVRTAFTEPYVREVVCYEDILDASVRARNADSGMPEEKPPAEQKGYMHNVLEEALEEMLFQVARQAVVKGATAAA